jgi:hypothetical protein
MSQNVGYPSIVWFTKLTTSGVVGDVGKPVDVVGYSISSKAAAALPSFLNGSTQANAVFGWADQGRVAASEQTIGLAYRVRMPLGCWVSFDANTSNVTVFYQQVLT